MKKLLILLPIIALASCGANQEAPDNTQSGIENTQNTTDTNRDQTNTVALGQLVEAHYTLRENDENGPVIQTTHETVARENGLYETGAFFGPVELQVVDGALIPGFLKNIIGMKVGEKKTFTVSPEEWYGTSGREESVIYELVAPVFTITQEKSYLGPTITDTISKEQIMTTEAGKEFLANLEGKWPGDTVLGPTGISAKIIEITDDVITLEIDNVFNPFRDTGIEIGAVGKDTDGNEYKIIAINGEEVEIEVTNGNTPFTKETFVVGGTVESGGSTLTIKAIEEGIVHLETTSPLTNKTLHFDLEIVSIQQ